MKKRYLERELEKKFNNGKEGIYFLFERDVRCLMAANTMDAHLAELGKDKSCKPAGKAALLAIGHDFTELIRQGKPEAARQYLIERIEPTLDTVRKENGYLAVLKDLSGDADFLKEWLCKQKRDEESMEN